MATQARVSFHTLGCKLNFSESSAMAQRFQAAGYASVPFGQPAEVVVINTCSVTENADKKARKAVKYALKHSPDAFVAVVGCYAQLKPQEIAKIPGVDAVFGAADKFQLLERIGDFRKRSEPIITHGDIREVTDFVPSFSLEERTRAFLKVQDGCDYKCSFCTIPLARGASRSDSPENVLAHAHRLAEEGAQEIVLTGINLGDYRNNGLSFHDLAARLDAQGPQVRYRISSIEPNLLENRSIDLVAASSRFMPHFHLPLQSGDNELLGRMRRRYKRELYADRVARIREKMPHACIGVDVIVGYPGETEAQFEATYRFLLALPVSYLHVFPFSARANTVADSLGEAVPEAVKRGRVDRLRSLSARKRRQHAQAFLGTSRPVLWEEHSGPTDELLGWTDNYIRVKTPFEHGLVNQVTLTHLTTPTADHELLGSPRLAEVLVG